ncbi:hypothetical protein M8J71_10995 [Pseudarthrobacter sp. R1]|uniref:HNH endonuclease n=1 Tax=Pseudarthrobacter sp. R1 TaxID=2944934 RepID=UPI00210AF32B|nr:hypothetical protein [Pseudarthrobacter sp. R1]MCQ6271010.1 hypothetical protein [Pseudarthrobacter sp. R1]
MRRKVIRALEDIETNNGTFKSYISQNLGHALSEESLQVSGVSKDDFIWLYTTQLAKRTRPARVIYDSIVQAAPNGLCCYCQYGKASTLDHFVPKAVVSALAIDPWNLVPACSDCNHEMLDEFSNQEERQFLHPYFIPAIGRWLYAEVVEGSPATLQFFANPDSALPDALRHRISNQHTELKLSGLYAIVSAQDLAEISNNVRRIYAAGGASAVQDHLREMSQDCFAADVNNRRGVLYEALANSPWYYGGGFNE